MADPGDQHPLWLGNAPLILASGSRTRFDLLVAAGIPVEAIRPRVDERALSDPLEKTGESADRIAAALAIAKASSVSSANPGRFVLGADQTLSCGPVHLHKPSDRASAKAQLTFLSGKTHRLCSAVAITRDGRTVATFTAIAELTMRTLSSRMIDCYLDAAGHSVLESVGGYQLERLGSHLFEAIVGEHSTILGLPILETLENLRKLDLVVR